MNSLKKSLLLSTASILGVAVSANAGDFSQQEFVEWVGARCGTGEPVYWYARGDARAFPGGEILFRFDFMEENRLVVDPKDPESKICLGRKMNLFLDKDTGEILREFRGKPVEQLIYPYQMIAMSLQDGRVDAVATQGAGDFVRTYTLEDIVQVVQYAGRTQFDASAMFTARRPEGVLNTFEYLSYAMPPVVDGAQNPNPSVSFTMGYERPEWAGGDGKSDYLLQHVVGSRVSTYDELPEHIREFIKTDAPAFVAPPVDLAEIERLQKAG